jgi:hypothetical protein
LAREEGAEELLADLLRRRRGGKRGLRMQVAARAAQAGPDMGPLLGAPGQAKRAFPLSCRGFEDLYDELAIRAGADLDRKVPVLDRAASSRKPAKEPILWERLPLTYLDSRFR